MFHTKTQEDLASEIGEAERLVKIGGVYSHYKNPASRYTVINLAISEVTEKVCVVYRAEYGRKLLFTRDLDIWLEEVEVDGKSVPRFKKESS